MDKISFSQMGLSKLFPFTWWISNERGLPYCIKTTSMSCLEASSSTINVYLMSTMARIGVVRIASLSFSKSLIAS